MEIEIFQVESGYGYRVGNVFQEYDPDEPGFVPMSRERAIISAQEVLARISS